MQGGTDPSMTPFGNKGGTPPSGEPPDRMRDYLDRRIGGRPLMVYLVLFAGAAILFLLLAIVWISATGGGEGEQPICLDIAKDDAISQVYAGSVKRVNVLIDDANPTLGPFALQLDMSDGSCRKLPEGIDNQSGMLEVLGAVEFSNTIGDQRVRTNYQRTQVPPELMQTATPTVQPTAPGAIAAPEEPTTAPADEAAPATPPADQETTEQPTGTPTQ